MEGQKDTQNIVNSLFEEFDKLNVGGENQPVV
jgi:hypothetical protein